MEYSVASKASEGGAGVCADAMIAAAQAMSLEARLNDNQEPLVGIYGGRRLLYNWRRLPLGSIPGRGYVEQDASNHMLVMQVADLAGEWGVFCFVALTSFGFECLYAALLCLLAYSQP